MRSLEHALDGLELDESNAFVPFVRQQHLCALSTRPTEVLPPSGFELKVQMLIPSRSLAYSIAKRGRRPFGRAAPLPVLRMRPVKQRASSKEARSCFALPFASWRWTTRN
jgi:hypothetical protein